MAGSAEPSVTMDGSRADATRRIDGSRAGLPVQLSSFVGRARELAELARRFESSRLVTLTGPGGSGKTRLALKLAEDLRHRSRDGVFFVDLASTTDPGLVPSTIAGVLGIWEEPGRPVLDTLAERLDEKRVLVVLDNLEQLPGASPLIGELLARCPNLHVLATSRSPLHLRGEHEYAVDPLALPTPDEVDRPDRLRRSEAVALFIARAQAISPHFDLTSENAAPIAEICRRLDGLPLAIELAAASAKLLGPQALLARLEERLPLPTGRAADAPARQRTLHDTIAWSHDLLSERERRIFARLSVFVDGCTLPAAEAVIHDAGDPVPAPDLLEDLSHLVDSSVLQVATDPDGEPRFSMLHTIRGFALERLAVGDEKELIERRHATVYLALAERAAEELLGARQRAWSDRLDREGGNLRAALLWSIEHGAPEVASRLGAALWRYWQLRGHLAEGRAWLDRILGLPALEDRASERASVLEAAGGVAYWQGDLAAAEVLYQEALDLRRDLGEPAAIAQALYNLSFVYFLPKRDLPRARSLLEESLAVYRGLGDRAGVGKVYWALSTVTYVESQASARPDVALAVAYNEQSQVIFRESGDQFGLGWALHWRGLMALSSADMGTAHARFREGLRLFAEAGDVSGVTILLDDFAALAVAEGDLERAARLSGAAAALQRLGGTDLASVLARLYSRPRPEDVRSDEERIARAWMAGHALSAEAAVALALSPAPESAQDGADMETARRGRTAERDRHGLTPREREVLELLATGRPDGEIAAALFITKKTASTHVANIKDKLGADDRVGLVLMARQLVSSGTKDDVG